MVTITVLKAFGDLDARVNRKSGDVFEATEERAEYIESKLPGYISISHGEADEVTEPAKDTDLTKATVAELRAMCSERGIEVPKGAKKADIIALLEG